MKSNRVDVISVLLEVLADKTAPLADRDDAAINLGQFDDDRVLAALLAVCSDFSEDEIVLSSAG